MLEKNYNKILFLTALFALGLLIRPLPTKAAGVCCCLNKDNYLSIIGDSFHPFNISDQSDCDKAKTGTNPTASTYPICQYASTPEQCASAAAQSLPELIPACKCTKTGSGGGTSIYSPLAVPGLDYNTIFSPNLAFHTSPVASQKDCDTLNSSVNHDCAFCASPNNCTSALTAPCASTVCTKSDKACPKGISDCKTDIGNALCKDNVCWFDELAMKQYQSGTSIFGMKVDLRIQQPILGVTIPDLTFSKLASTTATEENGSTYLHIPYIGEYLAAMYKFGMVAVSIVGVIMIVVVGFKITVMGGEERVNGFKRIGQIAIGLFIAWGSYAILYNINPDLVTFQALKILYIQRQELPETIDISTILASKDMQCFYDTFGSSEADVAKQTTHVNILGVSYQVHKLAAAAFQKVASEINSNVYRAQNTKKLSSTGFVWRANTNAKNSPSLHSFGIAIDINSGANPNINCTPHEGKTLPGACLGPRKPPVPCPHDIPPEIIQAFKSNGFRWGGEYKTGCDAMHFEWLGPCAKGAPGWTPSADSKAKTNKTMMGEGWYCCKLKTGEAVSIQNPDDCNPDNQGTGSPTPGPCP